MFYRVRVIAELEKFGLLQDEYVIVPVILSPEAVPVIVAL